MRTDYEYDSPELELSKDGTVDCIRHNHERSIDNSAYIESELQQHIDRQTIAIKGCIAFFKTYAGENSTNIAVKALAAAAVAEDEARLGVFQKQRPGGGCVIL